MRSPIDYTAQGLDTVRAKLLRWTLSLEVLRRIFCNRAYRNFFLFLLFILTAWIVSWTVPLWQLLLGPMFYGYLHLFSSVRYFHYAVANDQQLYNRRLMSRGYSLLLVLVLSYFLYRVGLRHGFLPDVAAQLSEWQGAALGEAGFIMAVFIVAAVVYRKSAKRITLGLLLLAPLAFALMEAPFTTVGLLVLAHNVVGFVYWILACRSSQDRNFATAALAIFLTVNVAIFTGVFDGLYDIIARSEQLAFAGLTYWDLGGLIVPWSNDVDLRFHAVAALAFGQSTHYYVWLKAIPDQYHYHHVPTSFRQSVRLLNRDFGPVQAKVIIYLVVAAALVWVFISIREARGVYFMIAAFHGYLEIAGLGLIGTRSKPGPRPGRARDTASSAGSSISV